MVYTAESDKKYIENLKKKIARLKKERKAVIIVHNYQREEVQDIADHIGDSLALSQTAVNVDAEVIVFCGVHFMAESAAILNPEKKVLLPVKEAGCPMADMVTAEKLKVMRQKYPDAAVVCYVNSSARVKAESDICCTSSNAIEVVGSLPNKQIIFVPDKNLGAYIQLNVPDKEIILWNGFCPTHIRLTEEEVLEAKKEYPRAEFVAHPECRPEVLALADKALSTGGMFKYIKNSSAREFIIGTERGLVYRLEKENSEKKFYLPSEHLVCANMKLITLGWVAHSLELMIHEITVPEEIREKAKLSLDRMLEVSKEKKWQVVAGY
jgi:quinolinate synthase